MRPYVSRCFQQCALVYVCVCSVNMLLHGRHANYFLLEWKGKKIWWCLPTVQALNQHRTTHTCTHTLVSSTSRSRVQSSWKLGSPHSPPPYCSYPLLSYMTLCNLLIWMWVLMTQSQGWLLELDESSRRRREEYREGEQTGWRRHGGLDEESQYVASLFLPLLLSISHPLTGWCRGGHYVPSSIWSASSLPSINNPPPTHTHNTHREHWVQTRSKIHCVCALTCCTLGYSSALLC